MAFVFGYGSLLRPGGGGRACRLRGHRRVWGVAMDNRRAIAGYKVYEDAGGGRPAVYVAFLDLVADACESVGGVAFPVGPEELGALGARERNYARADVTGLLDADLGGRVHAYLGLPEARARLAAGRAAGTAVVARAYLEAVRVAFEAHGMPGEIEAPDLPVRDLTRVDLPGPGTAAG